MQDRYAGYAKDRLAHLREEPFVFQLFARIVGFGELVKAVRDDEAAAPELAPLRAKIIDRLAIVPWPTPSPLNQIADAAYCRKHNMRDIGDPDVGPGGDVRYAFSEADLDLQVLEIFSDGGNIHLQPIVIAHTSLPACSASMFQLCSHDACDAFRVGQSS